MVMGCIPVFVADYTVYPYQEILDYTRFGVFLRESEIPILGTLFRTIYIKHNIFIFKLGDMLSSYSKQQMEEMQAVSRIIARRSFLYHDDPPELIKGPYSIIDWVMKAFYLRRMVFSWDQIWGTGSLPAYVLPLLQDK